MDNNAVKFPYIIYKNLDLGDIIIEYNDIPLIIIERKTIPDLLASIKDGRYKEQKKRIRKLNPLKVFSIHMIKL